MSAAQYFVDREALIAAASKALKGLISYTEVHDRLNQRHHDTVFVVVSEYDNGCPEDYNRSDLGMFRNHDDATEVLAYFNKLSKDEDISHYIEVRRIY